VEDDTDLPVWLGQRRRGGRAGRPSMTSVRHGGARAIESGLLPGSTEPGLTSVPFRLGRAQPPHITDEPKQSRAEPAAGTAAHARGGAPPHAPSPTRACCCPRPLGIRDPLAPVPRHRHSLPTWRAAPSKASGREEPQLMMQPLSQQSSQRCTLDEQGSNSGILGGYTY
jgi:hypothetical protein